ncbi:monovalent cation/H(+) antiporter subunit G [Flexibacterium corallicola]|uniref:monovalent cation/H(+) antiporter subunit G n=1 Tax=Flexibacterium corallicola TaxID=3037259 RepID=UPI00286EF82C|nr:monovalent cation/H(+) antiporter subunit G [Pseudovibrio sp. M1P-2-3]
MTMAIVNIVVGLVVIVAGVFALAGAIGIVRFKDVYMRAHAASKAGTLGSGLFLLALGLHVMELDVITRAVAGFVFFLLTAPVAAHLIARASHMVGYRPCPETKQDALYEAQEKFSKGE